MNTLFALVLTVISLNGESQDVVIDVYDNQQQCQAAAVEQNVNGECWPVEGIIRNGEIPASL
ncbi:MULTISPECIES: YebW family protein [Enterobacter]|uniref:YebW family protein n=1 Tax=Enterobacter intestinihominis TaxID=3133180 RepID=A0ABV1ZJY7_9ENTR|nr:MULTISPECIES: YebW family protein [Enterobacter]MBS6128836.1 YebW family protein [Enterobacter cloacae]AWR69316.1 DUF1482 domain-containing protein [Enterobacter hormaechei subsp. xiangfangensis]AXM00116.1 DUF1482 domain-containing protein [Enterobacter hormaechei subsp. xiangfangensis]EHK3215396.1 YebW family protein [Enterobacter hormaechei]EHK3220468.1 YebW family protein [Enterobacter hormaechei]